MMIIPVFSPGDKYMTLNNIIYDEIKMYLDARYISSSESIWRIFHYRLHNHTSNVQRLAVHLPNQQSVTFQDGDNLQNIVNHANRRMTTLTAWFQENLKNTAAHKYKYIDFPLYYTCPMKKDCRIFI